MIRDPLYRAILQRMNERVDPHVFESCAMDLLRDAYPGLAPVPGGNDAGYDGAVPAVEGPFPVTCTTAKNVVTNVRRSCAEAKRRTRGRRDVVVACSRELGQPARQKVMQAARESGYNVLNIHDQADFANRLYRNPRWRKELLGISGSPPALSRFALSSRSIGATTLTGREAEYARIASANSDLLVVGQPGSGKTFLHERWASEAGCLFLATDDEAAIADQIREGGVSCIVVDDGHLRPERLARLRHIRTEIDASFRIHANCWPQFRERCSHELSVGESAILELPLLTRDQMVQVAKEHLVLGPDRLLHFLLDEARGKPGLLVALIQALKRGEQERVFTGEALAGLLLRAKELANGSDERAVLAAFAIGGDAGMTLNAVSSALSLPEPQILKLVTELEHGGIVEDVDDEHLAVMPSTLRSALIQEVFFRGGASLSPAKLVEMAPSAADTAETLMSARQRGARVPTDMIERLAMRANARDAWKQFAHVDSECANGLIDRHPERVAIAAGGLLVNTPGRAMPLLLDVLAQRPSSRDYIASELLQLLSEWLVADSHTNERIARRTSLLRAVEQWNVPETSQAHRMLGRILAQVIAPDFSTGSTQPGSGRQFVLTQGVYALPILKDITALWPRVLGIAKAARLPVWAPLLDEIAKFCNPGSIERVKPFPKPITRFLRATGHEMLRALLDLPNSPRPLRQWIARTGRKNRMRLTVGTDATFELLFGEVRREADHGASLRKMRREFASLALGLVSRGADEALTYLDELEREAAEFERVSGGYHRVMLYQEIAKSAINPAEWATKMVKQQVQEWLTGPMLQRAASVDLEAVRPLLNTLLDETAYRRTALTIALSIKPSGDELTSLAVSRTEGGGHEVAYWLSGLDMAHDTRRALLTHPNPATRSIAAIAEWLRTPRGIPEKQLVDVWRSAVLEITEEDDHVLSQIMQADDELACDWIAARLTHTEKHWMWKHDRVLVPAARILNRTQRQRLLGLINADNYSLRAFDALVGDDYSLFEEWFSDCSDSYLRQLALRRGPGERWMAYADIAYRAGLPVEEIAKSCYPPSGGGCGPASVRFREWRSQYEEMLSSSHLVSQEAARLGMEWTTREMNACLQEERDEEVYGVGGKQPRRRRR